MAVRYGFAAEVHEGSGLTRTRTHGRRGERLLAGPGRWLLLPGWLVYRPLLGMRNLAYDAGWLPVHRLPVPVVSVGNLALGGTGKTPLAARVVQICRDLGRRPAVLSRGYRAAPGAAGNDEAIAMDCSVISDPDRYRGGQRAVADGAECLVLDDGFQHRRLHRDLDLLCLDATCPFGMPGGGRGGVLPLGFLREPVSALRRCDVLVLSRSDQTAPQRVASLRSAMSAFGKPIFTARHVPDRLVDLQGGNAVDPAAELAGRPVWLVSGIGHPRAFEDTVVALGAEVRGSERFPDHHHYTGAEARALLRRADACGALLLVTGKDAVKLAPLLPASAPCRVLQVGVEIDEPEDFRALLAQALAGSRRRPDRAPSRLKAEG